MKRRLVWTAACILTLLIAALITIRLSAAPVRDLYSQDRSQVPMFTSIECPIDRQIEKLIARAQFDYLVSPIPRWRGKLMFKEARVAAPNDIYLIFMPQGESENAVVYCCARESGRLLWKGLWVRSA
jgi:hypothetical protein